MSAYAKEENWLVEALWYKEANLTAPFCYLSYNSESQRAGLIADFAGIVSHNQSESLHIIIGFLQRNMALCYYLTYLAQFGIPLVYWKIAATANIFQTNNPNMKPVGKKWPAAWIHTHPQFQVIKKKSIE
jgi:hypothetical protein